MNQLIFEKMRSKMSFFFAFVVIFPMFNLWFNLNAQFSTMVGSVSMLMMPKFNHLPFNVPTYLLSSRSIISRAICFSRPFIYLSPFPGFYLSIYLSIPLYHIDSVLSIFKTGSTLKCRYVLGLDFTALTHLYFSVAFFMHI